MIETKLLDIPNSIFELIFDKLTVLELNNLALICKKLSSLKNDPYLFFNKYKELSIEMVLFSKILKPTWIEIFIKEGVDIHHDNELALRLAIHRDNYEITKILLENGADIHIYNDNPLRQAIKRGKYEIIKLLLDYGANINVHNGFPLCYALKKNNYEIVKLLLDYNADIHIPYIKRNPILNLRNVHKMSDVMKKNYGSSALLYATNNLDIFESLLKLGAKPPINLYNIINIDHIKLLLKYKIKLSISILEKAITSNNIESIELLINYFKYIPSTFLKLAYSNCNVSTIKLLLKYCKNINQTEYFGFIIAYYNYQVFEYILKNKIKKNIDISNLFINSIIFGQYKMVEYFIKNYNINNINIDQAFNIASKKGFNKTIKVLLNNNLKITDFTYPLILASANLFSKTVNLLINHINDNDLLVNIVYYIIKTCSNSDHINNNRFIILKYIVERSDYNDILKIIAIIKFFNDEDAINYLIINDIIKSDIIIDYQIDQDIFEKKFEELKYYIKSIQDQEFEKYVIMYEMKDNRVINDINIINKKYNFKKLNILLE